jgi:hypothetical protein
MSCRMLPTTGHMGNYTSLTAVTLDSSDGHVTALLMDNGFKSGLLSHLFRWQNKIRCDHAMSDGRKRNGIRKYIVLLGVDFVFT